MAYIHQGALGISSPGPLFTIPVSLLPSSTAERSDQALPTLPWTLLCSYRGAGRGEPLSAPLSDPLPSSPQGPLWFLPLDLCILGPSPKMPPFLCPCHQALSEHFPFICPLVG